MRSILVAIVALAASLTSVRAADIYTPSYYDLPAAAPTKPLVCGLSTEATTRFLSANTGLYLTRHAAQVTDLYCQHQTSGFYVDVWNLTPYGTFSDGGEVDVRAGWQKNFGPWSVDLSGAWYNYRIQGLGVLNNANARGKIAYTFDVGPYWVMQSYLLGDYNHSFDFNTRGGNAFAIAAGTYAGYKLTRELEIGVGGEVWQYATHFADNPTSTIYNLGPQVSYLLTQNTKLYAKAALVHGSVIKAQEHGWKESYSVGVSHKF